MKDSNKDFARIERFDPIIDVYRGHSGSHRRIIIRGHDGSRNSFVIQHPAVKQCRREERTHNFFRLLNTTLDRRIESRKRNLKFHLPVVIPLAPQIRLVEDDSSNISLQGIFELHAKESGFDKDYPIKYYTDRLRSACMNEDLSSKSVNSFLNQKQEIISLKAEINQEISQKMIHDRLVTNYFWNIMVSFEDNWNLRKRFTNQMACVCFMTYLLSVGNRTPQKFYISKEKGTIWFPDLYAGIFC
jgi:transformation/transcription domain-associated protein